MLLTSALVAAPKVKPEEVPEVLRPWIPWILSEAERETCTPLGDQHRCAWPSALSLELTDRGGEFELEYYAELRERYRVPGGATAYPADVTVDSKPTPTTKVDGFPHVELEPGFHRVRGRFQWARLPDALDVGSDTAHITLKLRGAPVPLIKRDAAKIWLQPSALAGDGEGRDELEVTVFRRIQDGPFLSIETRLILQVSGRTREVAFEHPLLEESLPLSVSGDLAVSLEPTGRLRVQAVPGRHVLTLMARAGAPTPSLHRGKNAAPWPEDEVWTFRGETSLRAVEVQGLMGVDPSRTDLPEAWKSASAYIVGPDAGMTLATTRRGEEQIRQNQLDLRREFWLDEAAQAFTVVDHFSGEMTRDFRLDLNTGDLGAVSLSGQDQLVTLGPSGRPGVELREAHVELEAVSRVERGATLAAVGWSSDVRTLSADLHLPPGWDVFMVSNVDESQDTWVGRWSLFDVFYALVVAAAMFRLGGPLQGAVALVALVLSRDHAGAPDLLWLPWIALGALLRFVPEGRILSLLRWSYNALSLVVVIVLLTFSVSQIRRALYPHLDASGSDFGPIPSVLVGAAPAPEESKEGGMGTRDEDVAQAVQAESIQAPEKRRAVKDQPAEDYAPSSALSVSKRQLKYRPDAVVQTGPGVPVTRGSSWHLGWSGPVVANQGIRLYLLSPGANAFLTALRLISLFFLFAFVARLGTKNPFAWLTRPRVIAALCLPVLLSLPIRNASAEGLPSTEQLAELKARLLAPPACAPDCLTVPRLEVELGHEVIFRAQVNASAKVAYQLPGPLSSFRSWSVSQDGKPGLALRREADDTLLLQLGPGVHEVELRVQLASERAAIDVGSWPEHVSLTGTGYTVTGVGEQGVVSGRTLTFQREGARQGGAPEQSANVPPYFLVERILELGVTSTATTRVTRVSQAASPETLRLPLLPFERVITPGLEAERGVVELSFPREGTVQTFESSIVLAGGEEAAKLTLTAPSASLETEIWTIRCGVVYSCALTGLVPTSHLEEGRSVLKFHPWPGEKLTLDVKTTRAAKGEHITVRSAVLKLIPGLRTARGELTVEFQTSRSLIHVLTIPTNATLERAAVDGVEQAVKVDQGRVGLALEPGTRHVTLHWVDGSPLSMLFKTPALDVGARGVNFQTIVEIPTERWVLAVGGPRQGPALLFWGYLILIVAMAFILPRVPLCPLRTRSWLLLGLGLTQVPVAAAVFIGGWFFAIAARHSFLSLGRLSRNFLQLVLVFYSVGFLIALFGAVYSGLASSPDMSIEGAGSYPGNLSWYVDRSAGAFRTSWILSVSVWFFRVAMLVWALWLSSALLGWLKWAWVELRRDGFWVPRPVSPLAPLAAERDTTADLGAPASQPGHEKEP